jgi:hypothetical protein
MDSLLLNCQLREGQSLTAQVACLGATPEYLRAADELGGSLTVDPSHVFIGDPPIGKPYPGTTWIGDFPPPFWAQPYVPNVPYEPPAKSDMFDHLHVFPWTVLPTVPSPWTCSYLVDRIVAHADLPGVRASDLVVELAGGNIKVTGKRFDTMLPVSLQFTIGYDYDPTTAEASLEAGVLSVIVFKAKDKQVHRVTVTTK